jgi:hypothetical protein
MADLARVAQHIISFARSIVAVFSASTVAIISCGVVPALLMRLPFDAMIHPSRPFLLFALAYSATVGVPFFFVLSRRRRLTVGTYMAYGVELACLAMIALGFDYSAPSLWETRRLFDLSWIVLTSGVPAGLAAGVVAYAAMRVGQT